MADTNDQLSSRVARRMRDRRLDLGLSQADLGAMLGIDPARVSELERGKGTFTLEKIEQIASALDISVSALLGVRPPKR